MNPTALVLLDYFGIAVFAISGALLAAEKRQTLVTFIFFAVVTGVGGGTLRDLLIGAPVFWVHANATLLICISAALIVWLLSRRWFAGQALLWFDAAGLAAYATYGAAKALAYGVAPVPAFAMGVMTAWDDLPLPDSVQALIVGREITGLSAISGRKPNRP